MKLKILLFGMAQDAVGSRTLELEMSGQTPTIEQLKTRLITGYPQLRELSSLLFAVNSEYADSKTLLKTGDEIAIIPPTSGG